MRTLPLVSAGLAFGLLGACANPSIVGEAGVGPGNGSFGLAYANNELVQSAEYQRGDYIEEVRAAFGSTVPDQITFDFNKSSIDGAAKRALDQQAAWLRENPTVRVRVTGHTDLVGGEGYNDRLGLRRARSVARYLLRQGVARGRIDMVESRGESEPIVATEERERRNRRTVTEVAGFVHGFVGEGMDGRRALLMYQRYVTDTVEAPAEVSTDSGGGQ